MTTTRETRNPGGGRIAKPKTSLPARTQAQTVFDSKPGLVAAIQRLRQAEIQAAQDFELARSTDDPDLIARKKKDWTDLIEQLRKVEVSNPDVQRANAETVPVADVERGTARMISTFRVALEALPRSLPPKLIGLDEIGIQEVIAQALNEALSQLHTGQWSAKE